MSRFRNPFSSKSSPKTAFDETQEPPSASMYSGPLQSSPMTNARLEGLITQISQSVKGELGYWQFDIGGRDMLVITDAGHNRMRIMSPVAAQEGLDAAELAKLLEANFASALDAKYALRDGTLWSVFTHPLAELTDEQFLDCAAQVANLAGNFGGSYASSNLIFGGG